MHVIVVKNMNLIPLRKKKTIKEEAKVGPDCACKRKCMTNLNITNLAIIDTIFKSYWALGHYNLQTCYLLALSKSKHTTAQGTLGNNNTKRSKNRTIFG